MPHIAHQLAEVLKSRNEKIVFAESCTGGKVSAMMAEIPGISEYLCGSFVTYRASQKIVALKVTQYAIDKFTTESTEIAQAMAVGALGNAPEAEWTAAIVGHLGPNAPAKKDGKIYICIGGREWMRALPIAKLDSFKCYEYTLESKTRQERMIEAAEYLIAKTTKLIKEME